MLTNIRTLVGTLHERGVRYCHWKSNAALAEALGGFTDVDLLVRRQDASVFRAALAQCCFRPAGDLQGGSCPSTEHYFGLDSETGALAHIHAYFRVITGESLAKNYHLPLEDMLLQNTRQEDGIRVPTKAAELVVFTIRMMLKHTTLVELAFVLRDSGSLQREIVWLADDDSLAQALQLLRQYLPNVDSALFADCVSALRAPAPLLKRLQLARRLRASVRMYARHSRIRASWTGIANLSRMAIRRVMRGPQGPLLRSGGALVAFVGPEATGKSTLIGEVRAWLGEHFAVCQLHAGKPRSTLLTLVPNTLVPLLRLVAPRHRPSELEARHSATEFDSPAEWVYPLSFATRCVLLAYDRRVLLTRAFARAANGSIVLCDRYPFMAPGVPDGPRLMHYRLPHGQYRIRTLLARLERQLYLQIPRPDLTISLTTPIEIAVARNRTRGKYEPEEYVRRRHSAAAAIPTDQGLVCSINTNQQLGDTLREVKAAVWSVL